MLEAIPPRRYGFFFVCYIYAKGLLVLQKQVIVPTRDGIAHITENRTQQNRTQRKMGGQKMTQEKKQWKWKVLLACLLVVLIAGAGVTYYFFSQKPSEGSKAITIEVVSDRDKFTSTDKYTTDQEFLGDFLIEKKIVQAEKSDYGRFIVSAKDMKSDDANQYWWSVKVDGEMSATGMDTIPVTDGSVYTLTLEQGY